MLSKRQSSFVTKIKQAINNNDTLIHLRGPAGSGKTTLVEHLIKLDISKFEDWIIYNIEGKKNPVEAYSTIIHADGVHSPNSELMGYNVNLGFKLSELLTLGFEMVFQKKPLVDPKVNFFLQQLNKSTAANILIVADSFQYWDVPSQQFLMTLKQFSKKLLPQKHVCILLVTDEDAKDVSSYIDLNELYAGGLDLVYKLPNRLELREALHVLGYSGEKISEDELDIIMSITGGQLEFIKFFIEGYYYSRQSKLSTETSVVDMMKLLEYRMERFGAKKDELSNVLQVSSILSGDFKLDQVQYLLKNSDNIEDLLEESCNHEFLKMSNHYIFSNVFIQELFFKKLKNSRKDFRLQMQYSKYLQENEPENYVGRAYYLFLGDRFNDHILEIIELFSMAYFQSIASLVVDAESQRIETLIKDTFERQPDSEDVKRQFNNFLHLKIAYELYFQERYDDAITELNKLPTMGTALLMSEITRMKLVVSLMLDMDTGNIRVLTQQLQNTLDTLNPLEKEQWCKISLTLFSTYSNKFGDFDKSNEIATSLQVFINDNYRSRNGFYEYVGNIIARKACVFTNAALAVSKTGHSVEYFEKKNDYFQYYLALCNHSGNQIVIGQYEAAISCLHTCLDLIKKHPTIQFPSQQKIYNNLILSKFLLEFRSKGPGFSQSCITEALTSFKTKATEYSLESNAIMYINMINLFLLNLDFQSSDKLIIELQKKVLKKNNDSFYRYYLANIYVAKSILQRSWEQAEQYWNDMNNNFPTYHKKNETLINKRNIAIKKLITQKVSADPYHLDEWVYNNANALDDAGGFYCRLLLFSDLQFTSI